MRDGVALTRVVDRLEGGTDIIYCNYTCRHSVPELDQAEQRNNTVSCSDSNYFTVSPVKSPATGFYKLDPENRFWELD